MARGASLEEAASRHALISPLCLHRRHHMAYVTTAQANTSTSTYYQHLTLALNTRTYLYRKLNPTQGALTMRACRTSRSGSPRAGWQRARCIPHPTRYIPRATSRVRQSHLLHPTCYIPRDTPRRRCLWYTRGARLSIAHARLIQHASDIAQVRLHWRDGGRGVARHKGR